MRRSRNGTQPFVMMPYHVLDNSRLSGSDFLVYLVLARHADWHTGECFPSLVHIARECRLSNRTICRSLENLEAASILSIIRTPGQVNHYYLPMPNNTTTPAK